MERISKIGRQKDKKILKKSIYISRDSRKCACVSYQFYFYTQIGNIAKKERRTNNLPSPLEKDPKFDNFGFSGLIKTKKWIANLKNQWHIKNIDFLTITNLLLKCITFNY